MSNAKRDKVIPSSMQSSYSPSDIKFPALLAYASLFGAAYLGVNYPHLLGVKARQLTSDSDRLVYTLKLLIFPAATLLLSMFHVMSCRGRHPAARNPLSGHEFYVEVANRILQNTLEQFALFLPNLVAFALQVSPRYFHLVPVVVGIWSIGRVAYLIGYAQHPKHRLFGFTWSFTPTLILVGYNVAKFVGLV